MSRWVTAQTFNSRSEAELAKELLEQKRIHAMVRADDIAGLRPSLTFASGVDLQVQEENLREAQSVLTEL
jgi:hypothetical protein